MFKTKRRKQKLNNVKDNKYKQLDISIFFVAKKTITIKDKNMSLNECPVPIKDDLIFEQTDISNCTDHKEVKLEEPESNNNDLCMQFPISKYGLSADEDVVRVSDEEMHTPKKVKKLEECSSNSNCTTNSAADYTSYSYSPTPKFSMLRLRRTSSLIDKENCQVDLEGVISEPQILQKSMSNESSIHISKEDLSDYISDDPCILSSPLQNLLHSENNQKGIFPPTKVEDLTDTSLKSQVLYKKFINNQSLPSPLLNPEELSSPPQICSSKNDVFQSQCAQPATNTLLSENNQTKNPTKAIETRSNIVEQNINYLKHFRRIYNFVLFHPQLSTLLNLKEMMLMGIFLNAIDERYAYLCIRLFLRIQKWNNIFKLKNDFRMELCDLEVKDMYECLLENNFIVSDLSADSSIELLNLLTVPDIRDLCKNFKLRTVGEKKSELIKKLLNNCNHQSILIPYATTESILRKQISEKLGICIKLSPAIYNVFEKIHLLYLFTNREHKKISDLYFFLNKLYTREIILPEYYINKNTVVFSSVDEFTSYVEAEECRSAMEQAYEKKQRNHMLELCEFACNKLLMIYDQELKDVKLSHLFRYTPGYAYTRALSYGVKFLTKHYSERVEEFLKMLLQIHKSDYFRRKRGEWYDLLVMIQYNYRKLHEVAAETIIEALADENLSEIDRCLLNRRAESIKNSRINRLPSLVSDRICFAQSTGKLPSIEIDAQTIHSEGHSKRKHFLQKVNGDTFVVTVEQLALSHYLSSGYTDGRHCEGSLIWTIFFVLLWDIIYDDSIPDIFISDLQYLPLDFYNEEFYTRRKDAIDKLFHEMELWSDLQLAIHVKKNWKHSLKRSLIDTKLQLVHEQITDIILCITISILIKIFRRILSDMRSFRSGLPDLFLWNAESKQCKFVEVKSDKDKLSCSQDVWLRFLKSIGCDVQVCHVHSIGTKSRACNKKRQ